MGYRVLASHLNTILNATDYDVFLFLSARLANYVNVKVRSAISNLYYITGVFLYKKEFYMKI